MGVGSMVFWFTSFLSGRFHSDDWEGEVLPSSPIMWDIKGFGIFSLLFSIYTRLLSEPICHHVLMTACWWYLIIYFYSWQIKCLEAVKSLDEEQQASAESWQDWVVLAFGPNCFQDYAIFASGWDCTAPHRPSMQSGSWHKTHNQWTGSSHD